MCIRDSLKEFDAYFINKKSADVYIEQIIGVFHDSKEEYGCKTLGKLYERLDRYELVMTDKGVCLLYTSRCV